MSLGAGTSMQGAGRRWGGWNGQEEKQGRDWSGKEGGLNWEEDRAVAVVLLIFYPTSLP